LTLLPVGPSAIAAEGEAYTKNGRQKLGTPRALELSEIPRIVEDFRRAAANAKRAEFDGVEIHGANGYLIDQFLHDGSNKRTDAYGGSIQNRARLALEITDAVISVWGPDRVGYRISPGNPIHSMHDTTALETFSYLVQELATRKIGYLHILESVKSSDSEKFTPALRRIFNASLIVNAGYDYELATQAIKNGAAELVAFGIPYLANPDLPRRFEIGAPLNAPDPTTFYGGGSQGYTDYPSLAE
jgi:N-ethylmaleimide reductase